MLASKATYSVWEFNSHLPHVSSFLFTEARWEENILYKTGGDAQNRVFWVWPFLSALHADMQSLHRRVAAFPQNSSIRGTAVPAV